jgi:hypothetical protein
MKRIVIVDSSGTVTNVSTMEDDGIISPIPDPPVAPNAPADSASESEIAAFRNAATEYFFLRKKWIEEAPKYWFPPEGETALVSEVGEIGDVYDSATQTFTTPEPAPEPEPAE